MVCQHSRVEQRLFIDPSHKNLYFFLLVDDYSTLMHEHCLRQKSVTANISFNYAENLKVQLLLLAGPRAIFSKIDLKGGFHQFKIVEQD